MNRLLLILCGAISFDRIRVIHIFLTPSSRHRNNNKFIKLSIDKAPIWAIPKLRIHT
jgi:hypothetical protein